jgi:hypothetical protein
VERVERRGDGLYPVREGAAMSETGASNAQIEAACAARVDDVWTSGESWEQIEDDRKRAAREIFLSYARYLVDPDHVIVRRSDVAAVLSFIAANDERFWDPDVLERLAAVLEP